MAFRSLGACLSLSFALAGPAWAQVEEMTSIRGGNAGTGARIGENTYLKLSVVAEAGYDTNVFYNDVRKTDSSIVQVSPSLTLTNDNSEGGGYAPPLRFALGASLLYREYLTDEAGAETKRAFNPTFSGQLGYTPSTSFSLALSDQLTRMEDAPYSPDSGVIERFYNIAMLDLRLTPGGGRLQGTSRYSNAIDIFETESARYANRMVHDLMLGASWKWLPKTAIFLEVGGGYIQYLDSTQAAAQGRVNSIPYRALAGIRGLLTPKVAVNLGLGYADSAYNNDVADPSGLSTILARASVSYDPLSQTKIMLAYEHKFVDSPFVGNYFDVDTAGLSIAQKVSAFVLRAFYAYEFRRYKGSRSGDRVDHLQRAGVQADYFLQRWFFAGVGYSAQVNRSSMGAALAGQTANDYTKHVILGRLGISY